MSSDREFQAGAARRLWGSLFKDFLVKGKATRKRPASSDTTGRASKIRKTEGRRPYPTLARDPESLLSIAEDLEREEVQADAEVEVTTNVDDTSDLGGLGDDEIADEEEEANEEIVREVSRESSLQMSDCVVENMMNAMTGAFQDFPSEDVMNECEYLLLGQLRLPLSSMMYFHLNYV